MHPQLLCRFVAPYFAGPGNPQRLNSRPCLGPAKGSPAPYFRFVDGRPQAASLVQGLRPRNAPLQKHASPTGAPSSRRYACPAVCLPPTNDVSKKASMVPAVEGWSSMAPKKRADGMKTVLQRSCPFPNLSSLYGWGHEKLITDHSLLRQRLSKNLGCTPQNAEIALCPTICYTCN